MQQTTQGVQTFKRPSKFAMFFHGFKTLNLIRELLIDERVPLARKAFFLVPVLGLILILIFPDALNEAFLSTVLPIIGTILGIPIDAGFDWVAFALAVMALLQIFPKEVVAEHYQDIFHHEQN